MFEDFLRKMTGAKPRPRLTEEQKQAISDKLHKEIGTALNNAAAAGMPVDVETKYLLSVTLPLVKGIAEGHGRDGAFITIVNEQTGEKLVDGANWEERTVH